MKDVRFAKAAKWCFAAGAAIISVSTALSRIIYAEWYVFWFPAIAGGAGLGLLIFGLIAWIVSRTSFPGAYGYRCRVAAKKQLEPIHKLASTYLGDNISSLSTMKQWVNKNPSIFFVVVMERNKKYVFSDEIFGYYCLIPLQLEALAKLESGTIDGRDIPTDLIAKTRKDCAAIYIGGVAARTGKARAALMTALDTQLLRDSRPWSKVFYTRPVTKDGLVAATRYGFEPIDKSKKGSLDAVYRLDTSE